MTTSPTARFVPTMIPTGEPWHENCYIVLDREEREQAIVDPGGRSQQIIEAAESAGAPVRTILLTHAHHDHVRAAAEVAQHFAVSCHIHSADFPLLRKAPSYSVAFGGKPFPPVQNPVPLQEKERLSFGLDALRILHTPGHTPGSCCLLFPGFALTGDTLLNRKVGRTDLPGCDRKALIASVDTLLASVTEDDILFAGHRDPWTAREARLWWTETRNSAPALDQFEPESIRDGVTN